MPDRDERPRATRRRGATLDQAILTAAAEELAEVGYARLTMDSVAARAGTSKTVIYRRWPSRAALSVAAYRQMVQDTASEAPDNGDLRADAMDLLVRVNARMSSPSGHVLRELLSGLQDDVDRIREVRDQLVSASVGPWLTVLARAVARGEADPASLTPRVATVAVDLLRNEYAIHGAVELPRGVLDEIIDQVYLPLVTRGAGRS